MEPPTAFDGGGTCGRCCGTSNKRSHNLLVALIVEVVLRGRAQQQKVGETLCARTAAFSGMALGTASIGLLLRLFSVLVVAEVRFCRYL